MYLKRHYARAEDGEITQPPRITALEVLHTGVSAKQKFSTGFIDWGVQAGFMTLSKGAIILHTEPEELNYKILKGPGRYCCHCGEKLDDDAIGEIARLHVKQRHEAKTSPDATNPAGYVMRSSYKCVLDAKQHERWRCTDLPGWKATLKSAAWVKTQLQGVARG